MKKIYHVCITAHKEVLMRNINDARAFTNLTALAAYRTDTQILVDALMSNHAHFVLFSENPSRFALALRLSMTKHFNYTYSRRGRLFDKKPFISELVGSRHTLMAINYVLRNGLHHGQSETAFAYPFGTCNYINMKARGVSAPKLITDRRYIRSFLPINAQFPDYMAVEENGFISRSCFEEIRMAETLYGSPNTFIYNMNRRSSNDWINEQSLDDIVTDPITLMTIEKGTSMNTETEMIKNENGGRAFNSQYNDMELCEIIDNNCIGRFKVDSIYKLNREKKNMLAKELVKDLHVGVLQVARCLAFPEFVRETKSAPMRY